MTVDGMSCICGDTPIIIDTRGGRGIVLSSPQDGVMFDLRGNGSPSKYSWPESGTGNAFLFLDRNGNGVVDNGLELFGNLTPQPQSKSPNGFLALAEFDKPANGGNGDGIIDARDAVFSQLRLWIDENRDGISQPEELFTLPQLGVTALSFDYKAAKRTDQYGNTFRYRATVASDQQGVARWAWDVILVGTPETTSPNLRHERKPR